jgi:adenosylcobinamide kinase/adenosylcobinamide-phosphate guanylyltransferase
MMLSIARSELILGGQKSGKSRRAEALAAAWLAANPGHRALLIATAQAHDEEMRQRIARHQSDRAARVPRMQTLEEPRDLAGALAQHSAPDTLIVVDCLTLWLTQWAMPVAEMFDEKRAPAHDWPAQAALFLKYWRKPLGPLFWWATRSAWGSFPWDARCAPLSMRWALEPAGGAGLRRVTRWRLGCRFP